MRTQVRISSDSFSWNGKDGAAVLTDLGWREPPSQIDVESMRTGRTISFLFESTTKSQDNETTAFCYLSLCEQFSLTLFND